MFDHQLLLKVDEIFVEDFIVSCSGLRDALSLYFVGSPLPPPVAPVAALRSVSELLLNLQLSLNKEPIVQCMSGY